MKLSVIIVSYNAVSYLDQCLESIIQYKIPNIELIVWDNNSTDRSILNLKAKYPEVQFYFNEINLGFSKGNNCAVEKARGEYVLILNPDTAILSNTFFSDILSFADNHPEMGVAGVRMINANGEFLPESKRNLPNVRNSISKLFKLNFSQTKPYYATHLAEDEVGPVEVLSGACMLMRRQNYRKVGGFDERYFMYGEDIDLSYTMLQNGFQNYYLGNLTLLHHKGESTVKDKKYLDRFYGAMALFLEKYEKPNNLILYYLALLGVKLKHSIALLKLKL
ncbi:MAG: glycosyltransferase family 2 protein [Weeksellaceae bacterium]